MLSQMNDALIDSLKIDRSASVRREGRPAWFWIVAVVAVLAIASAIAWWFTRPAIAEVRIVRPEMVRVDGPAAATSVLDASGYVVARRQATVAAEVTGKLVEVRVEEGQPVEEGQVLARLDDATEQAQLDLAQALQRRAGQGRRRFGAARLFLNFENFLDTKQSNYAPVVLGPRTNPRFADIWAPMDGFIINGGVKYEW